MPASLKTNARLPRGDRVAVAVDQPVRDKGENQGIPFPPGVGIACGLGDFLRGRVEPSDPAYFVSEIGLRGPAHGALRPVRCS